jgi:hypothetical protein
MYSARREIFQVLSQDIFNFYKRPQALKIFTVALRATQTFIFLKIALCAIHSRAFA